MADVQWIKLYIDMFDKRKINKLRRLPAGNDILLIWIMLLAMAGKCNAGGMIFITESVPFTVEDLADELDFEINTIRLALEAFQQFDMADVSDNGFISICNWEEYQNIDGMDKIREQNRIRKQRQREREKLLLGESRDSHATVTQSHATEEEREKEKEEEYHSFIHSAKNDDEFLDDDERREALLSQQRTALQGKLGGGVVFLSDEQMEDLLKKLSLDEFHHYIGIVRDCELKGKSYKKKTHYQAIIDMAIKDRKVLPNGD